MTDFSNEGLYRLLEKMDREQGEELRAIRKQTTETNGRVLVLESNALRTEQELKRISAVVFPAKAVVVPDRPNHRRRQDAPALSLSLSPKMWAALAAWAGAFSLMIPTILKWIEKHLGL